MPTYEYRCLTCHEHFDAVQSFTDPDLTVCNCGKAQPVRKVFTPVGITFKGSGFYKTDSRGGSSSRSNGSSDKTDKSEKSDKTEKSAADTAAGNGHGHDHSSSSSSSSSSSTSSGSSTTSTTSSSAD